MYSVSLLYSKAAVNHLRSHWATYVRHCFSKTSNHYEVLGLCRTASKKEIRSAYLKLSKQYHPDLKPELGGKGDKFNIVREAYDTLSDEEKRYKYDYELLRMNNPDMPQSDHIMAPFYRDGTIYSGPKDHHEKKNMFTNTQVVLLAILLSVVGAVVQLGLVNGFAKRREMREKKTHEEGLLHLENVRNKLSSGHSRLRLNLAEHRDSKARRERHLDPDTLIDTAPSAKD